MGPEAAAPAYRAKSMPDFPDMFIKSVGLLNAIFNPSPALLRFCPKVFAAATLLCSAAKFWEAILAASCVAAVLAVPALAAAAAVFAFVALANADGAPGPGDIPAAPDAAPEAPAPIKLEPSPAPP